MTGIRILCLVLLLSSIGTVPLDAQALGSLDVLVRGVKIDGKQGIISRKRFYLLNGGLKDNQALTTKLKTAEIRSRDCYYSQMQASPQFICWLKAENCESPYCRSITDSDVARVPEFQAAYKKGLTQFKGLTTIARDWITTNLPPILTSGYYQEGKTLTASLLGATPIQSSMTDGKGVKTTFINIPIPAVSGKTTGTFFVSNILPFEYGGKSYVWACEVEIGPDKLVSLVLTLPNTKKNCEVYVRDLPVCKTEGCQSK